MSLIKNVFKAQLKNPNQNDWCETVKCDLEELKLNLTFNDIENMNKSKFKKIVKDATNKMAFLDLNSMKEKHIKVKHIHYKGLKIQRYLSKKKKNYI